MNIHARWLEDTWPGGLASYIAGQQSRWVAAHAAGDQATIAELTADMARVGYQLQTPRRVVIADRPVEPGTTPASWPVSGEYTGALGYAGAVAGPAPRAGPVTLPGAAVAGGIGRGLGDVWGLLRETIAWVKTGIWPAVERNLGLIFAVILAFAAARIFRVRLRLGR